MIEVVLDTNIFRNDPLRRKAGFNAVVRLAKSGKLRLHIPYFVQGEFVSQQIENYEKHVNAISKAISQLQRKPIPDVLNERLDELNEVFTEIQGDLTIYPETEFSIWLDDIHGVVHPVSDQHGVRIARDYFDGAPPFKKKKSREDIPDAFIWQVILDLANEYEELYVVAGDKEIRNSCESVPNITAFGSLDDFVASDICRFILREEAARETTERLIKYLPLILSIRQENIEEQLIVILEGTNVQSDIIPNSTHVATISNVEELKQITLKDLTYAQYYGEGVIIVPFLASVDAVLEYELLKGDYHNLSGRRTERIDVSEFDKFRYTAEESYSLDATGNISITVDPQKIVESSLSDQDIRSLVDHAIFEIDSLTQAKAVDWDPISNRWEQRFLELLRYKRKHGDCAVPQQYSENEFLGRWVHNQRQRHRIGKLSENRVRRLNEMGFSWRVSSRFIEFDVYIELLLAYKQIYGHMNVSQLDPKYRRLGRWLNAQRTKKSRGTLLQEHEDKLNEIGVVWNVPEARWQQRLDELETFHKTHGHFTVPRNYKEYPKLYDWSRKIRKKQPTADRLKKLKAIGFIWEEEHKDIGRLQRDAWERNIKALRKFYEENEHINVQYDEDIALYSWLYRLRKDKPTKEQLEQLEAIDFNWHEEASRNKLEEKWDLKLNELKSFYEANGHFDVPTKENPTLYRWLYKIKTKKPPKERLDKLQNIGFKWQKEHDKLNRRKK